jgi:RimJ/RimL family protein N-acetyltransferase
MEIKEATIKDWKEVRDLYLTLLKENPQAFADDYNEIFLQTEDDWVKTLEKKYGKTFVAVEDSKFVGMGRVNFYDKFPEIPVLHKLGVLSEYRDKGIAKELVQIRENWAKSMEAKKVMLYVMANNEKAIKFAEKNGYRLLEKFENDVQEHGGEYVDVLLMEKDLA